jgi:hypothetical protein
METRFTFKDEYISVPLDYNNIGRYLFYDRNETDKYYYILDSLAYFFSFDNHLYVSTINDYPKYYTKEMDTLKHYRKFELNRDLPYN